MDPELLPTTIATSWKGDALMTGRESAVFGDARIEDERDRDIDSSALQLVLCLDGTSNTLTGRQRDTNVLRLFEQIATFGDANQKLYYDPGVGSPDSLPVTDPLDWLERKLVRISGLAYGRGVYDNVAQAYAFLMREWSAGCEIYLFGFSRGAFTARCVAGMVNLFGILSPEHDPLIDTLLRVYFAAEGSQLKIGTTSLRKKAAEMLLGLAVEKGSDRTRAAVASQVRQSFARGARADAAVKFVGVWDTVESVGIPGLSLKITSSPTIRGKRMCHVRHALALDEHRRPFEPRLYRDDDFGTPADAQSMRQLWFRGAHGDVGGGYAPSESALSNEALVWLAAEARRCGLRGAPICCETAKKVAHDPIFTVPWWAFTGMSVRDTTGGGAVTPVEHASVAGAGPRNVWQGPFAWTALSFALFGALFGWWLQGRLMAELPLSYDALAASAHATLHFAWVKLSMLWHVPLGAWREEWRPFLGAPLGAITIADLVFVASYGYVAAVFASWAFSTCAGFRRADSKRPWWNVLGVAMPLLVFGHVVEDLLTYWALDLEKPMAAWQAGVLWLASVASIVKFASALALVLVLLPLGGLSRLRVVLAQRRSAEGS